MMRRLGFLLIVAFVMVSGCAQKEDLTTPNLPPETYVAIADSVRNPTVYIQVLHWWGEDIDGEVVGYEYKWELDPTEGTCGFDTTWIFTEETGDTFHLPVTEDTGTHRFYVRAIDDDGSADPTPASTSFPVTNSPPSVRIWDIGSLPDTTYPAFAFKWHGEDPEGDETIAEYLVWLDGETLPRVLDAQDTMVTLTVDDFGGRYGERTVYLVAIDSGCDTSNVATYSWFVKQPEGNVLLVDNLPREYAGYRVGDRFYRTSLDSCIGTYSVLDIEHFGGNRYSFAFESLFELFDLVIWYNDPWHDPDQGRDTLYLAPVAPILPDFVAGGGRLILISHTAVGTRGAFRDSATLQFFGIDSLYLRENSTDFDCKRWIVYGNGAVGLDTVKVNGLFMGAECMKPQQDATPLFHIPPGTVGPEQTVDYYVGIMNDYGDGKVALLTFPISRSNTYRNNQSVFCKLVELMLN